MRSPARTPFFAVFQNELLLNSKRIAPYALMALFAGNAVLWWGWSAAAYYGWAVNSEFNIARNFGGFSFITGLPIFNALLMGDAVVRDFRTGISPLIFSKPIGRVSYLLGKFCGNFLVLVCCQAAFAVTMLLLQWLPSPRVAVLPARVLPYVKHFLLLLVISHLFLAAIYFTVGTLTRNAKIVYGLSVAFYPLYIAYQVALKDLPSRWRAALDPLLLSGQSVPRERWQDAEWINHLPVVYTPEMLANRAALILLAAAFLAILCLRFTRDERPAKQSSSSVLDLSMKSERIYQDSETLRASRDVARVQSARLPEVSMESVGFRANLRRVCAATAIELRLLRAERSLVVLTPLAMLLGFLSLPVRVALDETSASAAYASEAAQSLLLFLLGVILFYTGEAMHRDREVKIEPVVWASPVTNHVLLLSKFTATFLLALWLQALVTLTALLTQLLRGHAPLQLSPYLLTLALILLPSIAFITSAAIALNVLLRDKYLTYAVSISIGSALFYLYSQGYRHWLYNPLLYQLWNYADLSREGSTQAVILTHRIYCLALAALFLALAHLFFQRQTARGFLLKSRQAALTKSRLSGAAWSILLASLSLTIAIITARIIISCLP